MHNDKELWCWEIVLYVLLIMYVFTLRLRRVELDGSWISAAVRACLPCQSLEEKGLEQVERGAFGCWSGDDRGKRI